MPVHNNILWKAPRARGGCRYPAKVKIETEHIDGIWYAGYVTAVRGEGAETRVLVKWPGTGAKRSKWFMLADAKVSHPLLGYATARERARKGAGGFVGLIAEADGAFEFEVDSIIAFCQRRKKYLVRWLGYGEEDDWKKADEIDPELVKEFNRLRNSRSAVSSANKRRIAKASYIGLTTKL